MDLQDTNTIYYADTPQEHGQNGSLSSFFRNNITPFHSSHHHPIATPTMSSFNQLIPFNGTAEDVARFSQELAIAESAVDSLAFNGATDFFKGDLFRAGIPRNVIKRVHGIHGFEAKVSDRFADALWYALTLMRNQVSPLNFCYTIISLTYAGSAR